MKLFGRLVLVLALLSGVAYAKKVKLFDISKYDLKKKNKNGLETFKVGNIIVKTDLKYHEDNEMYFSGSNIYVYMNDFTGVSVLMQQNTLSNQTYKNDYGEITLADDFGEEVSFKYKEDKLYIGTKKYTVGFRSTIRITVEDKKILIFNKKKKIASLSTEHMNSIVSYRQRFSGMKHYYSPNYIRQRIYKFLIFGENKETPKKEKIDAK